MRGCSSRVSGSIGKGVSRMSRSRFPKLASAASSFFALACIRVPIALGGSHIRKRGRKPVSAAIGSAMKPRATPGCTIRCTASRRPYSVACPSPERVRRIGLPCQRSFNAASVFCRLSEFMACPPRNCPPSSEKRPRLGCPVAKSFVSPSKVGSVTVLSAEGGAAGSGPSACRSASAAMRFSPLPFLASPRMRSRSPFQSACAFAQLCMASRWACAASFSWARSAAISGASQADFRSPLRAIVRAKRDRGRSPPSVCTSAKPCTASDATARAEAAGIATGACVMPCTASTTARSGPSDATG